MICIPLIGALTDKVGRRPIYILGAALAMVWPFVAFPMLDTGASGYICFAIMLGLAVHSMMYAAQPAVMSEMFPTRMRYSGVSLGYQVTALVAGSWAPLIATALLRAYGISLPIAIYVAGAAAV